MKTYFDSSSFAKRFVEEAGSDKVEKICANTEALGLSIICVPEIISALNRRKREKSLTRLQYDSAKRHLLADVRDVDMINLTPSVISFSTSILETSSVRALDALHIACAIEWGTDLFVSSDKRQLDAAKKAGLKIQVV